MLDSRETVDAFTMMNEVMHSGMFKWQHDDVYANEVAATAIEMLAGVDKEVDIDVLIYAGKMLRNTDENAGKALNCMTSTAGSTQYEMGCGSPFANMLPEQQAMRLYGAVVSCDVIPDIFKNLEMVYSVDNLPRVSRLHRVCDSLRACRTLICAALEAQMQYQRENPPLPDLA